MDASATRDPQATRQRLLDVATLAFASVGLEGVRVDQLAEVAGINKRMIYHYFGGKQGLYEAVVQEAGMGFEPPDSLAELEAWQSQLADNMTDTRSRLLAWEGLRGEPDPASAASVAPPSRDAGDLALVFVALATFPKLCPQVVQSLTGHASDSDAFQERWERLQQRLMRLIQSAAKAPKERVRIHADAKPSVR